MNVRQLDIAGFMNHGETSVEFPAEGVVVVTGDNGSGKSTLAEAVAWAAWGKTLRGASPIPEGAKAQVDLHTETESIQRRSGKQTQLTWARVGEAPTYWQTPTKAQKALADVIGDFSTWRRTHVFTTDAAGFTQATDAERKRLLERLLGMERYELAYREAREELKTAQKRVAGEEQRLAVLSERVDGLEQRLEDAETVLAEKNLGSDPPDDLGALRDAIQEATRQKQGLEESRRAHRTKATEAATKLRQRRTEQRRLDTSNCPTCTQPIPPELTLTLAEEVTAAVAESEQAEVALQQRLDATDAELAELEQQISSLLDQRAEAIAARAAWDALAKERSRAKRTLDKVEEQLGAALDELDTVAETVDELSHHVDVVATAVQALGTKGYRAQMLVAALRGLQVAANGVLDHMTGGSLRLRLQAYEEKKGGKIDDAIALTLTGAGGGQGYRGASSGEKRRVDVALVLALATLADEGGTLFFDEVFDSLDSTGVDRLAELLGTLARGRAIVVITHSQDFAKRVPACERWHVTDGRVAKI